MQKVSLTSVLFMFTLLTVASIPFDGLSIEAGATLRLSDIFSSISIFILILYCNSSSRKVNKTFCHSFSLVYKILLIFFLICFFGNLAFLLDVPNLEAQSYFGEKFNSDELSIFRTSLKPLQACVDSIINFSWLLIPIIVIRNNFQIIKLAWVYTISSSLQASLGIVQFIYFLISGINLFPIYRGGLLGANSFTQNAYTIVQGIQFLRINAFAGEPKGLALTLCFGIATTYFIFACQVSNKRRFLLVVLLFIQLIALLLTMSTLGYFSFVVGVVLYAYFSHNKYLLICLMAISIAVFYYIIDIPSLIVSVFQTRFLERVGFEDMDLVYISFIQNSPSYLLFGTGFGTFHLASFEQASKIITWKFGIILPKLGILKILAISGCLGLAVLLTLFFSLLSKFSLIYRLQNPLQRKFYMHIKTLVIYMILAGVLVRLTPLGLLWIGIGFAITDKYFIFLDKKQINISLYNL